MMGKDNVSSSWWAAAVLGSAAVLGTASVHLRRKRAFATLTAVCQDMSGRVVVITGANTGIVRL